MPKGKYDNRVLSFLISIALALSALLQGTAVFAQDSTSGSELIDSLSVNPSEIRDRGQFTVSLSFSGQSENPEGDRYIYPGKEIYIPITGDQEAYATLNSQLPKIDNAEISADGNGIRIRFLDGIKNQYDIAGNLRITYQGFNKKQGTTHSLHVGDSAEVQITNSAGGDRGIFAGKTGMMYKNKSGYIAWRLRGNVNGDVKLGGPLRIHDKLGEGQKLSDDGISIGLYWGGQQHQTSRKTYPSINAFLDDPTYGHAAGSSISFNKSTGEIDVYIPESVLSGKEFAFLYNVEVTDPDLCEFNNHGDFYFYENGQPGHIEQDAVVTNTMSDADITGKTRAAININKVENGTSIPIPVVQFEVTREDGGVLYKGKDDKKVVLTTDENGQIRASGFIPGRMILREVGAPGYVLYDPQELIVLDIEAGNSDAIETIENDVKKIEIPVSKIWEDHDNQDGLRPESVTVKLLADGQPTDQNLVLTESNNWSGSFSGLDEYRGDQKIAYTVEETPVDGYESRITGDQKNGFTITNTHKTETVSVQGKKTWNDHDNQDGKRPSSITINLLKNGTKVDSRKVTGKDDWKWSFDGLDKFENGKPVTWSISEEQVEGYSSEIYGYDVTNSYTPGRTSIQVTKAWNDQDNQDGKRPDSVTIQLLANGKEVNGRTLLLTAANNWTDTFEGLNEYQAGKKIEYTIKEVSVGTGYTSTVSGNARDGFTITNSREVEKTSVAGKKTWNDQNNQDGKRPSSITINLLKNGVKAGSRTVTEADGWKWNFENLDKYENGKAINWSISEDQVDGYSTAINGYDVTNSYTPGKTSVQVTKAWADRDNQDGKRPENVKVQLLADGKEVEGKTLTLTATNNWTDTFTDLDEYAFGEKIQYSVKEETVGNGYTSVLSGSAEEGFTITNTREPEKISVAGQKTWDDQNNQDGKRPAAITINLLRNGTRMDSRTVTEADGWKWSFDGLDRFENGQPVTYAITEDQVEGYSSVITGYDVTNSYTPGKTSVQVTKAWEDHDNQDGKRPESVRVSLLANGKEVSGKTLILSAANNWSDSLTGLDEYQAGKKIQYTVKEEPVGSDYVSVITGNAADGFTITNTRETEKVSVAGQKTWDDQNNQDGKRPSSITVHLLKNGSRIDSRTVSKADDWKWNFTDLDKYENGKLITYSLEEDQVEGYSTSIHGYDITNTYTPEKTSVQVTKSWADHDNQDGVRPDSVTIQLLANGEAMEGNTLILSEDNNWTGSFQDLDEYVQGQKIDYSIQEEEIGSGYTSVITGNVEDGFVVTNTRETEKVSVAGQKTWDDENNQDGRRPSSITIQLCKNGTRIDARTVTEAEDWKWSFEDQDKYENGQEITYSISENPVECYTSIIDGYDVTNSYTPGKVSVPVRKAWIDDNNREGTRPQNITVQLLADGNVVEGQTLTLSEENNWMASFTNLDEYAAGKKIVYTVEETPVEGYESSISGNQKQGFVITNRAFKPWNPIEVSRRSFQVTKNWKLVGDEIPVDEIEVELYKNDEATGRKLKLNADNNWTASFMDLEAAESIESSKYHEYTVKEVGEENGMIQFGKTSFKVTCEGDMENGFVLTNEEKPARTTPEKPARTTPEKPKESEREQTRKSPGTAAGHFTAAYAGMMIFACSALTLLGFRKRTK